LVLPGVSAPLARARVLFAADPEPPGFHLPIGVFAMVDGRQIAKASGYTHR
jgi:hypothetical protein